MSTTRCDDRSSYGGYGTIAGDVCVLDCQVHDDSLVYVSEQAGGNLVWIFEGHVLYRVSVPVIIYGKWISCGLPDLVPISLPAAFVVIAGHVNIVLLGITSGRGHISVGYPGSDLIQVII